MSYTVFKKVKVYEKVLYPASNVKKIFFKKEYQIIYQTCRI